jgi:hypothetical protein
MNSREVYNAWKEKNSQIKVADNFADKVMTRIYQYQRLNTRTGFDIQHLVDFVSTHALAKAVMLAVGAAVGLVRIAFVVCVFLHS